MIILNKDVSLKLHISWGLRHFRRLPWSGWQLQYNFTQWKNALQLLLPMCCNSPSDFIRALFHFQYQGEQAPLPFDWNCMSCRGGLLLGICPLKIIMLRVLYQQHFSLEITNWIFIGLEQVMAWFIASFILVVTDNALFKHAGIRWLVLHHI